MAMPSNYRYERKFLVDQLDERQLEALVRLHPGLFYEPYPPRFINNIYFDTPDMQSYHDNVDGVSKRLKLRMRWYGRLLGSVAKPVLEFKIKQDVVGWKVSFPLLPLEVDATLDQRRLRRSLLSSDIPAEWQERLRDMAPVLMNRYHRRYYVSRDQRYRDHLRGGLGRLLACSPSRRHAALDPPVVGRRGVLSGDWRRWHHLRGV